VHNEKPTWNKALHVMALPIRRRPRTAVAAVLSTLLVAGAAQAAADPLQAAGRSQALHKLPAITACDWPMYGYDDARTMTSSCSSAPTPANAGSLHLKWVLKTADVVTASPSIADGTVYVGDWSGNFYAVDLATGRLDWETVLGPRRADGHADHHTGAYGTITSSAALADVNGALMAFVGGGDSVYALDASPAAMPDAKRVLWSTDLDAAHPDDHGEIESSPVVWQGAPGGPVVFVGSDANQDSGYVGEGVWALRAATGKVVWHFNPETYTHHALYGCGNVWSSPALGLDPSAKDPAQRAVLYFGTADCPDNSGTPCPSDGSDPYCPPGHSYGYAQRWQPYAESITAVEAASGKPIWSYQAFPPLNRNDDDYGSSAQLFTLPGGRPVVGEANKDGTYTVVDRTTGKLVWRRQETGNGNLEESFALGGFIGSTAVASQGGNPIVLGAPAINTPITYNPSTGQPTLQPLGTLLKGLPGMVAFSGVDGSASWSALELYSYGATSTANGVAYVGALDGLLRAYDVATGELLWAFPLLAPISSSAAISANTVVIGAGTSESDVEFKLCDNLPAALGQACKQTPLNQTINPLADLGAIWAFSN
jgi:polyvinyl alcohol dehydrogenase (cytochrome)